MKTSKKQIHITKTDKAVAWVNENLFPADYTVLSGVVVIFYDHEFQKSDILNAINS